MQIKDLIILAGGQGTRLKPVVKDLPKCMAPVNGIPFISYLIKYFLTQGVERFVFALGYKSEYFEDFITACLPSSAYKLSIEPEPLGTGGAIKLASTYINSRHTFITNGDTFFKANLDAVSTFHINNSADCTVSLKEMHDFSRYGKVDINEAGEVVNFNEKKYYPKGLINAGLYALNVEAFTRLNLPYKFSFEKDYLEKNYLDRKIKGILQNSYFIDIGIPEDYHTAQKKFYLLQ